MVKQLLYKLLLMVSIMLTARAYAVGYQSLDSIEHTAYIHALGQAQTNYDNAQIVINPLDKRLRMQNCDGELEAFSKKIGSGLGKQTIGVKCFSPVPWTVYVQAKVKVFKPVVVAAKPLDAGQIIRSNDVKIDTVDISQIRKAYFKEPQYVIGQQLKYPVVMGTIIAIKAIKAQKIVARGELITLLAQAGKMEVRMSGKALSDGSLGQIVKVKNMSSKRVVQGIVDAPGVVKVTM